MCSRVVYGGIGHRADIEDRTFTPVPKSVQNGSEEGILPAAVISGAPMELQARTVR